MIKGGFCGLVIGACLLVLPSISQWKDYFSAMKVYSTEIVEKKQFLPAMENIPPGIEDLSNMQKSRSFQCAGLSTVQYYLGAQGILLQSYTLAFIYFILVAACCLLYIKGKTQLLPNDGDFLFGFFLYMLSELFIIGYRAGYSQIEWIFAVFLILKQQKLPWFIYLILVTGLLLENIKLPKFRYQFEIAEICLFLILFYLTVARSYIRRFNSALGKSSQV